MKVLSLFDGMSCGMLAMLEAGVKVDRYVAYEIDKYAVRTSSHNFPMIEQRGDVFQADFTEFAGFDWLVGGSPCTYWSIAQTKNRETVASGMGWELFSQYVRALHEAKPKYFIYENNKSMSKAIRASIDETFGFEAVLINSALVSAQNRQRLYWVGKRNPDGTYSKVDVEQPEDRGILLRDILEDGIIWQEKSYTITTRCCGAIPEDTLKRHRHTMVAEPVEPRCVAQRGRYPENPKSRVAGLPTEQMFEAREDSKTNTLTTVQKDNLVAEPVNITQDGKGQCLRAAYYKDGIRNMVGNTVDRKTCVAEPVRIGTYPASDGKLLNSQSKRIYSIWGKAPSICASETGGNSDTSSPATRLYAEPVCLRYERSEEAKRCRKAYEAHEIKHGYNELNELHPRPDGKTNTLTTVLKDNQIMEPLQYEELSDEYYKGCADGNLVGMIENEGKYKNGKQPSQQYRVYSCEDKSVCVDTDQRKHYIIPYSTEFDDYGRPIKAIGKDGKEITIYEVRDGKITIKGKQYPIKLKDGYYIIRKLTASECKRLQTVPEWYEFPVSNSQAYKMLGNGWTCEVIAHILKSLKEA